MLINQKHFLPVRAARWRRAVSRKLISRKRSRHGTRRDFLSVSVVDSGYAGSIIRSDGRRRDRGVNTRQKDERWERLGKHVAMRVRIKRDVSRKLPPFCHVDRYCWVAKTAIRLFHKIALHRTSRLYRATFLAIISFVNSRSIFTLRHGPRQKLQPL